MEPKTIDKSSWLYKFCYGYREGPDKSDTCSLRAAFLLAFFLWPFMGIGLVIVVLTFAFMFVLGFLFAARPTFFDKYHYDSPMMIYQKWPRWCGYRIMPIIPLSILGMLWGLYALITSINFSWSGELSPAMSVIFIVFGFVVMSIALATIFSVIKYFFTKSESWQMIKQCCKDWKDKVCRPIIFTDSSKTKENPVI